MWKQTWADGIDEEEGRKSEPGTEPSFEGTLVFPDITGGANWYSPSYSPKTKLFYHTAREVGTTYYKGEADYKPGTAFTAGGGRRMDGDSCVCQREGVGSHHRKNGVGV